MLIYDDLHPAIRDNWLDLRIMNMVALVPITVLVSQLAQVKMVKISIVAASLRAHG